MTPITAVSTLSSVSSSFEMPYWQKEATALASTADFLPVSQPTAVQFDLSKDLIPVDLRARRTILTLVGIENTFQALSRYLPSCLQPHQQKAQCTLIAQLQGIDTLRVVHQSIRNTQIKILDALRNPHVLGYVPERLKDLLSSDTKIIYVSNAEHEDWGGNHQIDKLAVEASPIYWSAERKALIINVGHYSAVLHEASSSNLMRMWLGVMVHPSYRDQIARCNWLHEEMLDASSGKKMQSEKSEEVMPLIAHFNQSIEKILKIIMVDSNEKSSKLIKKMVFQLQPYIWLKAYFEGHADCISRTVIAYQVARLTPQVQKAIRSFGINNNHDPLQPLILRIGYETIDAIKKVYPDKNIHTSNVLHGDGFKELIFALDAKVTSRSALTIAHELSHLFQNNHFIRITGEIVENIFMPIFYQYVKADDNHAGVPDLILHQLIDYVKSSLKRVLEEPGAELIVSRVFNRETHDHPSISGIWGYYRYGEKLIARLGKTQYAEIIFGDHDAHWYSERMQWLSSVFAETGLQAMCEKAALEFKTALQQPNPNMVLEHLQSSMTSDVFWIKP